MLAPGSDVGWLLNPKLHPAGKNDKDLFSACKKFILIRNVGSTVLSLLMLLAACVMLLYAETAHGWTDALFLKVGREAVVSGVGCEPEASQDRKLVYVSCPVIYMHDFTAQLSGSYVTDLKYGMVQGADLSGLSIEVQTEIFQWREIENCNDCVGQLEDSKGNCEAPRIATQCKNTFEAVWVAQPILSEAFKCQADGQPGCYYPGGGVASVRNTGEIPRSMRSFNKVAESGSISIGSMPGRFYLSDELVAQLPSRTKPLLLNEAGLPQVSGKKTTLAGTSDNNEVRVQSDPLQLLPAIGDLRSFVTMTDFYNQDEQRVVSVMAEQESHASGEAHRTLVPWDSKLKSFQDGSSLKVSWLEEGSVSLDDLVADNKEDAMNDIRSTVSFLLVAGFVCMVKGVFLICSPIAHTWLSMRSWDRWLPAIRDTTFLLWTYILLSLGLALCLVAMPWFHYWPKCGGLLLLGGAVSLSTVVSMFWCMGLLDKFLPKRQPRPPTLTKRRSSTPAASEAPQEEEEPWVDPEGVVDMDYIAQCKANAAAQNRGYSSAAAEAAAAAAADEGTSLAPSPLLQSDYGATEIEPTGDLDEP